MSLSQEKRRQCLTALRSWQRRCVARRVPLAQVARQLGVDPSTLRAMYRSGCIRQLKRCAERDRLVNSRERFSSHMKSKHFSPRTIRAIRSAGRPTRRDTRRDERVLRRLALFGK